MNEIGAVRDESSKAGAAGVIRHPDRWGLLPELPADQKLDLPTLLRYWFV